MRKWVVALLILSSVLSGCIGFGFRGGGGGGRGEGGGGYYHHRDWR
jgi:hypothetical protein